MSKVLNKAIELLESRGLALMQSDVDEISIMFMDADDEDFEAHPWIFERIHMIASDPRYGGDIEITQTE